MFNSPVLDLVILLSFIYFMGSLILSAINEAISGALKSRPKQLKQAFENLFFEDGWKDFVQKELITSPHIQALMKEKGAYPSYIPAENFVSAIVGQLNTSDFTPEKLQDAINASTTLPPDFKKSLIDVAAQVQNNIDQFQKKIESLYNNAMDRAGGVYKKKIRLILLLLGFVIAFFMNLDTIKISRDALANKKQLSETVDKVVSQLPNIKVAKDSLGTVTIKQDNGTINVSHNLQGKDAAKTVSDLNIYLQQNAGASLGYKDWCAFVKQWTLNSKNAGNFFLSLLGIVITTFALQMSSSFWFDLMNKAVNVRAAGKKPDEKKDK